MSLRQTTNALDLFNKYADSPQALRVIAFYFLTKFPQHAENSVKALSAFPGPAYASASGGDDVWREVDVLVPAGSNQYGDWAEARYRLPVHQVRDLVRIAKSTGNATGKIEAIKKARNDLTIGLTCVILLLFAVGYYYLPIWKRHK